ncbi:sugar transporter [Chachezhania sediminis]|uniref:sugar transporter n=1 Tax=Chachezhania sediminis TaxID=2599291 RepID=UPI00131DCAAD|nr:sugar transporter [Chachezhania sediminis]
MTDPAKPSAPSARPESSDGDSAGTPAARRGPRAGGGGGPNAGQGPRKGPNAGDAAGKAGRIADRKAERRAERLALRNGPAALRAVPETGPDDSPDASWGTAPRAEPIPGPSATSAQTSSGTPEDADRTSSGTGPRKPKKKMGKLARGAAETTVVEVHPVAHRAGMRRRHWGLVLSFVLMVLLPFAGVAAYMWTLAEDQYSSVTGFTVRQEEGSSSADLLSPILSISGSTAAKDGDILYEFIQSQEMVQTINDRIDLRAHYSKNWPADWTWTPWTLPPAGQSWFSRFDGDWAFGLWPDASIEDLVWYWGRIVGVSYDGSTGLIEVEVKAFDPDTARAIGREIVSESQDMINALSAQAREDATRYARAELDEAVARLKDAREALTQFRTRTRIVDPAADLQGRMGVMNNLQQKLADALVEYDLLRGAVPDGDPRVKQALSLIDVIRERIAAERQSFATDITDTGAIGEDYPTLIAEYESLTVDREFAEETYRAALANLDAARADAARQSRYLATYIPPSLPQTAEYPRRWQITGLAALFLLLVWAIGAMIFYSIRDRG